MKNGPIKIGTPVTVGRVKEILKIIVELLPGFSKRFPLFY
jgi:hypothetical protein